MTDNIRLAFLADGESVHTKRWLRYFVDKEYDVHLITSTANPIKGVKIHELRFSLARNAYFRAHATFPSRVWNIRKTVKEINPDVLHAHYITNYGVCAALSGFHPLILSPWGSDIMIDPQQSQIKRFFIRFALKKADLIHTVSAHTRLIELGCDPRKIFVQQWGVDTNRFSPKARSQSLQNRLGIDSGYSVLCARYWKPQYNVELFIKAVPLVLKRMKNVKFVMLGGGTLGSKLKKLARRLGVYEDILFVGKIPEEEMPKYLASVDLYVDTCPRRTSGVGQTTRQAMACGTPQILTSRPGTKSSNWFFGVTCKQLDHQDMAETIVRLLKNEESRRIIGKKSREYALEILDEEKVIKQWEAIYHRLKGSYP